MYPSRPKKVSQHSTISDIIRKPLRTCPGARPASIARSSSGTFRRAVPKYVSWPFSSRSIPNLSPSGSLTMMKEISICPNAEVDTSRKYAASVSAGSLRTSIWKNGISSGQVNFTHSAPEGFRNVRGSIENIEKRRAGTRSDKSADRSASGIRLSS